MKINPAAPIGSVAIVTAAVCGLMGGGSSAVGQPSERELTRILVSSEDTGAEVSPYLNGANLRWTDNADGLWDAANDRPHTEGTELTAQAGVNLIRYPGGTIANLFDWKRAIGPQDQRGCQLSGRPNFAAPLDSTYGPDEHMQLVEAADAEAQIMVPFANETPQDAADWVEYMNAEQGSNPNGGTQWAAVRAGNGRAEPYGVRFWEIGNENYRPGGQRYWMARGEENDDVAMRQYAFGGTQRHENQRTGKGCDFDDVTSNGDAGQTFSVWFPPVVPDSQEVYVDGVAWESVQDLAAAGPDAAVYVIDPDSGTITFGDGVHGRIPPQGTHVTVDYDSGPHPGFIDFYDAMKAVDPSIDVCATWQTEEFVRLMAESGHAADYDCLSAHPYINIGQTFDPVWETPREGHDQYFIGEAAMAEEIRVLDDALRTHASPETYLAVSEYGALFFGQREAFDGWETNMSHALYNVSQIARMANLGLPWAEGNTLASPNGLRGVLGQPGFVYTAEAIAREAVSGLIDGGGTLVDHQVQANPVVQAEHTTAVGDSYDALLVTTSVDRDDSLNILVINRHPTDSVAAQVIPAGYEHTKQVKVTTASAEHFSDYNSPEHPEDVTIKRTQVATDSTSFGYRFPASSVTLLRLDRTGGSEQER